MWHYFFCPFNSSLERIKAAKNNVVLTVTRLFFNSLTERQRVIRIIYFERIALVFYVV